MAHHQQGLTSHIRRPATILAIAAGSSLVALLILRQRNYRGPRWYQVVYRLLYRLGLIIWQRRTPPPDLIALVEGPEPLLPGRALDLGCGTGTDSIYLATHGWDVTSIDAVPKALAIARRNAMAAGVTPRFIEGDVTCLPELGVGSGYSLLLDFGCFHTLPEDRRPAYVHSVSYAAAPGAILLLYGFRRPPKAAPMHAGVTVEEICRRFTSNGWELVDAQRVSSEALGVSRAGARFEIWRYQLRRADAS